MTQYLLQAAVGSGRYRGWTLIDDQSQTNIRQLMQKKASSILLMVNLILDFLLAAAALWLAQLAAPLVVGGLTSFGQTPSLSAMILFGLIWVAVLARLGAYDSEKNLRVVDEISNLIVGGLIANFIISSLIFLFKIPISRWQFLLFAIFAIILLFLPRLFIRLFLKEKFRKSGFQRRILIAGAGEVGRRFAHEMDDFSELGYTLVGFVDDDPRLVEVHTDVLGAIDQVPELVAAHQIDNLIIALPHGAYQRINALMRSVHNLPVRVWVIPDFFALMLSKSTVWNFVGIPMITLGSLSLSKPQRAVKRIFDLLLTLPLFILTLPLYALIAVLIKLDSPGPVLYRSTRLKENGETFEMLKFRTMVAGAEDHLAEVMQADRRGRPNHKSPDDPRLTAFGKLLRRTSLDELPQLIHVITGEMSLVGPRPELPELVQTYQPWQYMRFAVPQGLTGWWQVNGRSDKPMHLHTDEDLYYIQHFSLWLDIQILIKTVLVVLRGKGAY